MMQGWIHENLAFAGVKGVYQVTTSEAFTGVVDMSKYHQIIAILVLGDCGNQTIEFDCYTCDSGGTNAAAFKSTSTAAHTTNNDNKIIAIGLKADELAEGGTNANRYVKFGVDSDGTLGYAGVVVLGESKNRPASNDNVSGLVLEIEIDQD
jgi:hypothetical protein